MSEPSTNLIQSVAEAARYAERTKAEAATRARRAAILYAASRGDSAAADVVVADNALHDASDARAAAAADLYRIRAYSGPTSSETKAALAAHGRANVNERARLDVARAAHAAFWASPGSARAAAYADALVAVGARYASSPGAIDSIIAAARAAYDAAPSPAPKGPSAGIAPDAHARQVIGDATRSLLPDMVQAAADQMAPSAASRLLAIPPPGGASAPQAHAEWAEYARSVAEALHDADVRRHMVPIVSEVEQAARGLWQAALLVRADRRVACAEREAEMNDQAIATLLVALRRAQDAGIGDREGVGQACATAAAMVPA